MRTLANREYPDKMHFIWHTLFAKTKTVFKERNTVYFFHKILTCVPSEYTMDIPSLLYQSRWKNPLGHKRLIAVGPFKKNYIGFQSDQLVFKHNP